MLKLKLRILVILMQCCLVILVKGQDTVLLFHPTAYNLEVFQHLMDEGLLNLEGYHLLGVYHEGERYDYEKSAAYIEAHNAGQFSLMEIKGSLHPGVLFTENECSEQIEEIFTISEGALFMGGPDMSPDVYHEPVHLLTEVTDPYRHYWESSFIYHLLGGSQDPDWVPYMIHRKRYLISGICLGMQTLNVATGGTLVQDIPTEMYGIWLAEEILALPPEQMHRNYSDKVQSECDSLTSYHFHPVKLVNGSMLTDEMGFHSETAPLILSSHHQAVERLGEGLVISATSMDGMIVEALEHKVYPYVFGVQFHPEKPGLFDPGIVHQFDCVSTINFQDAIKNTESYEFHQAYWRYLGGILQEIRDSR